MKFKPGENLPVSARAVLAATGHDTGTVIYEGPTGAADPTSQPRPSQKAGS